VVTRALYASSPEWAVAGGWLDELVHSANFRVVKTDSRTLAGIAHVNGAEVFIKRVTIGSWTKGIITRVCGSRARKTIRGAEILQRAGFSHPRLIGAFEQRHGGSVRTTYVIVEYLHRAKMLSRFALADGRDFRWRCRISERLAQMIRLLHDTGCYTLDLQETNLMLEALDGGLKIYFTDLEDFRRSPLLTHRLRLLNLIHLDRSIGRFVSRTHRLRFLHNYLGDNAGAAEARELLGRLLRLRQRFERRRFRRQRSTAIVTPVPDIAHTGNVVPVPNGVAASSVSSLARRE
jgi:tRNA A-37 threonylcarbamoyl transferase component Bud32